MGIEWAHPAHCALPSACCGILFALIGCFATIASHFRLNHYEKAPSFHFWDELIWLDSFHPIPIWLRWHLIAVSLTYSRCCWHTADSQCAAIRTSGSTISSILFYPSDPSKSRYQCLPLLNFHSAMLGSRLAPLRKESACAIRKCACVHPNLWSLIWRSMYSTSKWKNRTHTFTTTKRCIQADLLTFGRCQRGPLNISTFWLPHQKFVKTSVDVLKSIQNFSETRRIYSTTPSQTLCPDKFQLLYIAYTLPNHAYCIRL